MSWDDIVYKLGFGARRREEVTQQFQARYSGLAQPVPPKVSLTASQHILHLLLTVFTGGLWLPVWIILAIRGNHATPPPQQWGAHPGQQWAAPPPWAGQQWPAQQQWPQQPAPQQQWPPATGQPPS